VSLEDFIKYQIEERDVIIITIPDPVMVVSVKLPRSTVRKLDKIVSNLKLRNDRISRHLLMRSIIEALVKYCAENNYCRDKNEITITIRL